MSLCASMPGAYFEPPHKMEEEPTSNCSHARKVSFSARSLQRKMLSSSETDQGILVGGLGRLPGSWPVDDTEQIYFDDLEDAQGDSPAELGWCLEHDHHRKSNMSSPPHHLHSPSTAKTIQPTSILKVKTTDASTIQSDLPAHPSSPPTLCNVIHPKIQHPQTPPRSSDNSVVLTKTSRPRSSSRGLRLGEKYILVVNEHGCKRTIKQVTPVHGRDYTEAEMDAVMANIRENYARLHRYNKRVRKTCIHQTMNNTMPLDSAVPQSYWENSERMHQRRNDGTMAMLGQFFGL